MTATHKRQIIRCVNARVLRTSLQQRREKHLNLCYLVRTTVEKMGKKSKGNNLGRSLIRDRFNKGHRRELTDNSMVRMKLLYNHRNVLKITYGVSIILRICL